MISARTALKGGWVRANWRLLAVAAIAISQIATVVAVVSIAPISEVQITLHNRETVPAYLRIYLDDMPTGSENVPDTPTESLYVAQGWPEREKFHVAPGRHSVCIDVAYDNEFDGIVDFNWTGEVGFNDVHQLHLVCSMNGTGYDILISYPVSTPPISQALRDPLVTIPAAILISLQVLFVVLVWRPTREPAGARAGPRRGP